MWIGPKQLTFAAKSAFILLLVGFGVVAFIGGGVDFRGYYAAATLVTRGGNPYDYRQLAPVLREITGHVGNNPYYYPPWFCLLFVPLTIIPYQAARAIWLLVNLIVYFLSLKQLESAIKWEPSGWARWCGYTASILMFGAYCLRSEQAGILVLFGLSLALNSIELDRPALVGLGLTIALTKPQASSLAVLFLGLWLLTREPCSAVWTIGHIVTLTVLTSVIIPNWWQIPREGFLRGLTYGLDGPGGIDSIRVNSTAYDFLTHVLNVAAPVQYVVVLLIGLSALCVTLFAWHCLQDIAILSSAATMLTLLVTPYALQYDYVLLTIPLFWMFSQLPDLRSITRFAVALLLLFSFSVLLWQEWSYEGYWQLLGVFAALLVVVASRKRTCVGQSDSNEQ